MYAQMEPWKLFFIVALPGMVSMFAMSIYAIFEGIFIGQILGEGAFAGCAGLSSVVMKDNVETLGKMAFYQCGNLSSINLSKKLTSIGVGAFADNIKLENKKRFQPCWCNRFKSA